MTARLVRLRIAGFKSFAEPVSLDILPGLTGIVGPNGCGKSNVADALRWAMGETSARSLRGGEMDDVIFAGTTARASRNLAEVSVSLEAGDTPLPAPFEAESELQVTRRIERGAGSSFRANGRELRARDVQTLYADLASGARSSGMVSQGRVAALVAAKPEERRQVLEEAAGIAGLHARRHEAELKLRAAEQNLGRADDSRVQLDAAREGLRRQARQAARYRAISDLIRAAEAEHLAVLHGRAAAAQTGAQAALDAAQAALAAAEQAHHTAGAALADAEAALPQPRQREAEARSVLERRRVEADSLAEQAQRARDEHAAAEIRLMHLADDLTASDRACSDAKDNVDRLAAECASLGQEWAALPAKLLAATEAARAARCNFEACRVAAQAAAEASATASGQVAQAGERLRHVAAQMAELQTRHEAAETERARAAELRVPQSALDEARRREAEAQAALEQARARLGLAEAARMEASSRAADAAGDVALQHAVKRQAGEAATSCAARLAEAEAAWLEVSEKLARLNGERVVAERQSAADRAAESAEAELAQSEKTIDVAEDAASSARAQAADARRAAEADASAARATQAARDVAEARMSQISGQMNEARHALASAEASPPTGGAMQAAHLALAASAAARTRAEEAARHAVSEAGEAARLAAEARASASEASAHLARLSAEAAGLSAALGPERQAGVLSGLQVPAGLEAAVGAALGAAAGASLDPAADAFWSALPPLGAPMPPAGTIPLASLVQAPDALVRALTYTVLLDTAEHGEAVQALLVPGMAAVDRAGGCWRWDGHVVRAGAPNPAAARILIHRRLTDLNAALHIARGADGEADSARMTLTNSAAAAEAQAGQVREAAEQARLRHDESLGVAERLRAAARARDEQVEALGHAAGRLQSELADAERQAAEAASACAALPQYDPVRLAGLEAHADACEAALSAARTHRQSCRTLATDLRQSAQALASRGALTLALVEAAQATSDRAASARQTAQLDLAEAQAALPTLPDLAALDDSCISLADAERRCRAEEADLRSARAAAETALEAARRIATDLHLARGQAEARWASLSDLCARAAADLSAGEQAFAEAERANANLPDAAALLVAAQDAQDTLEAARHAAAQAQTRADALESALAQLERAVPLASAELAGWQARLDEAVSRHENLGGRHGAASAEHEALAVKPAELSAQAGRLHQALAAASATHRAAEAALEAAHGRVRALAGAERDAAREAGVCREGLARGQASVEAAVTHIGTVAARIAERLGSGARLPDAPDVSDAALDRAVRRTERLARERDEMGPVNLRAELEMAELDERLAALARDQEELTTAIAKLRGAIGHLNREGRERLQAVFAQVDQHFRALFTRMMGGGQAHLAWTGSDDPLEAGLDIFAEPPGKKLASLSLLSGGEQALTALSLIFAVFRCTPAPLCVLDEVDAPLDDANVDRFCTLLEEMARETGTSFLVVTHHQLTMSRMDRLYGVTMQERGVSRLLSVDLSRAVALAEPVRAAAE